MRELSSQLSPLFMVGAWAGFALSTMMVPLGFLLLGLPPRELWVAAGLALLGALASLWGGRRLKKVVLDGTTFVISDFRRTIRVAAAEIEQVYPSVFRYWPGVIYLRFRRPTVFGSKVAFVPPLLPLRRLFSLGGDTPLVSDDPLVSEIRELALKAARR